MGGRVGNWASECVNTRPRRGNFSSRVCCILIKALFSRRIFRGNGPIFWLLFCTGPDLYKMSATFSDVRSHLVIWLMEIHVLSDAFIPHSHFTLSVWKGLIKICPLPSYSLRKFLVRVFLLWNVSHRPMWVPTWMLKTVISRFSLEMFQSCQFWCS